VSVRRILLVLFALMAGAGVAEAQTCTANLPGACSLNITTSLLIPKVVDVSLSSSSTTLTPPTVTDFTNGFVLDNGPTVTFKANTPWTASIRAGQATWTATVSTPGVTPWATKPASDLLWSTTSGSGYAAFTTSNVFLTSGVKTLGSSLALFFKTKETWTTDLPGKYTMPVVITITAP
jgi:hypothetical protein